MITFISEPLFSEDTYLLTIIDLGYMIKSKVDFLAVNKGFGVAVGFHLQILNTQISFNI